MGSSVLLVGVRSGPSDELAAALDAGPRVDVPDPAAYEGGEADWQRALAAWEENLPGPLSPTAGVVVCTWPSDAGGTAGRRVLDVGEAAWTATERMVAAWFVAVRTACVLCADGGSVAVVVERPAALDAAGYGPTSMIADAVIAAVRSLALGEGERGVRVNAVTTQLWSVPDRLPGLPPPLAAFPGTVTREVAGAVRLLLSPDAAGITGSTVRADCGRAW
jgi:NAD(P)-dependent dehydrogenase (short-subunit alcohol dehydrogenase family)